MYSLPSRRIRLFKFRKPVAVRSNQIITQRHNIFNGKLTLQMRIQHCGLVNGFLPMSHAVRLLTTTTLTLEEIALRVGLQNRAQMGAAFRRLYGVTPGVYCRLPPAQRQLPNPLRRFDIRIIHALVECKLIVFFRHSRVRWPNSEQCCFITASNRQ